MAPFGNQNALGNRGGRPTKYDPSYPEQARKLCMLRNCTDAELAEWFEVTISTISLWKEQYPEFSDAVYQGKIGCDFDITQSLYHRAKGYSHDAVKIVADAKTGQVVQVPYVEHYPPDTTAASLWLRNRHPDVWRDRQHVVVEDPDKVLARVLGVEPDALPEPAQVVNEVTTIEGVGGAEGASVGDPTPASVDLRSSAGGTVDLDKHQG